MRFEELIENASRNPQNVDLISEIMTSIFQVHQKTIIIAIYNSFGEFLADDEIVHIKDLDLAIKFIINFGKLITKLKFDGCSYMEYNRTYELLKLINQLCVNLVEVELPTNWSSLITKPFANVKKVSIMGWVVSRLDLNAIYPKLEELWLNRVSGPSFVIQNIPNLRKLVYSFNSQADYVIMPFLRKNKQIEEFQSGVYLSLPFLREISAELPKLKSFTFVMTSKFKPISTQLYFL